jgi:hypothetical protein
VIIINECNERRRHRQPPLMHYSGEPNKKRKKSSSRKYTRKPNMEKTDRQMGRRQQRNVKSTKFHESIGHENTLKPLLKLLNLGRLQRADFSSSSRAFQSQSFEQRKTIIFLGKLPDIFSSSLHSVTF